MTRKELLKKIGDALAAKLVELENLAKANGLSVKVKTSRLADGDGAFCIFIYDKSKKSSYMVGFDGHFDSEDLDFKTCIGLSVDWIKMYVKK